MARRATTVTRTRMQDVALAISLAAVSPGHLKAIKTTALLRTRGYEATSLPQWPWPPVRRAGPHPHRFRHTGQKPAPVF